MAIQRSALPMLWASMVLAVVIYAALVFFLVPVPEDSGPMDWAANPIALGLHVAAFGTFMTTFVLPTVLTRLRPSELSGGVSGAGWIIRWALLESVAIFGLLAAFLVKDARAFLILGLLSLAGFVITYPRAEPVASRER